MNDMKCPFCGQKLESHNYTSGRFRHTVMCVNKDYELDGVVLPKIIWQELIRTRKALDIAVDALKYANKCIKGACVNWETEIDRALEQITALEQKDVK